MSLEDPDGLIAAVQGEPKEPATEKKVAASALTRTTPPRVGVMSAVDDRYARVWSRLLPLLVLAPFLVGVLVIQVAFVQRGYTTAWAFAKPVALVELAQETDRLDFGPFGAPEPWIEETYEAHSQRWGTTVIFTVLADVTGADAEDVTWATALGVVPFLLALLFLFSRQGWASRGLATFAFLLAALGFVLNYAVIIWFYHGGGWPGTSLLFLMIGALFAYECVTSRRWLYAAAVIVFLLLQFPIYHSTAVISFGFLVVLAAYALLLRLIPMLKPSATTPAQPQPRRQLEHYFHLAAIAAAAIFLDSIFGFILDGLGPIVESPGGTFFDFFVAYFNGDNFFTADFVGFSFSTRVALFAPLIYMIAVSAVLWMRELYEFRRTRTLAQGQIIIHSLFVASLLTLASSLWFGGAPRPHESYFFILLAFPLLLLRPWAALPHAATLSKARLVAGTGSVAIAAISMLLILSDPFSQQPYTSGSEGAAGRWAAQNVETSYFADAKLANLALIEDPHTPVLSPIDPPGRIEALREIFYAGPVAFAEGLRATGAEFALLSNRNIEGQGHPKPAIFLMNAPIRPLPDYDYTSKPFGVIYDSGDQRVIQILPSEE